MPDRLPHQLAFIREIDRLKSILRRTTLNDGSRHENTAEHSWHLATMALVLGEYAPDGTDLQRAVQLNQITEEQALSFEAKLAGRILGEG